MRQPVSESRDSSVAAQGRASVPPWATRSRSICDAQAEIVSATARRTGAVRGALPPLAWLQDVLDDLNGSNGVGGSIAVGVTSGLTWGQFPVEVEGLDCGLRPGPLLYCQLLKTPRL